MDGLDALIAAAKLGDEPRVRAIVAADPKTLHRRLPSGESALMAALYRGHGHVVDALIELGAEVDVFAAAATGRLADLRDASRHPGAVNAWAYDGWTPLHLAAFFGRFEAARMLIDAGADLQAISRNSMKNTPLHAAAAGKHARIARLLLEFGADPAAIDAGGFTALAIARENRLDLEDG